MFDEPGQTSTQLASVAQPGLPGSDAEAVTAPDISADGRFVAFCSAAQDYAPGDVNDLGPDVFLRDLRTQTTERIACR